MRQNIINMLLLPLRSKKFYMIFLCLLSYHLVQAAKVPFRSDYYGCKIGNTIYWDSESYTESGGVFYTNFKPNGAYSDWLTCATFQSSNEPNYSCRVSGTRGYLGLIGKAPTEPCPLDSEWYIVGCVLMLSLIIYKKAGLLPTLG